MSVCEGHHSTGRTISNALFPASMSLPALAPAVSLDDDLSSDQPPGSVRHPGASSGGGAAPTSFAVVSRAAPLCPPSPTRPHARADRRARSTPKAARSQHSPPLSPPAVRLASSLATAAARRQVSLTAASAAAPESPPLCAFESSPPGSASSPHGPHHLPLVPLALLAPSSDTPPVRSPRGCGGCVGRPSPRTHKSPRDCGYGDGSTVPARVSLTGGGGDHLPIQRPQPLSPANDVTRWQRSVSQGTSSSSRPDSDDVLAATLPPVPTLPSLVPHVETHVPGGGWGFPLSPATSPPPPSSPLSPRLPAVSPPSSPRMRVPHGGDAIPAAGRQPRDPAVTTPTSSPQHPTSSALPQPPLPPPQQQQQPLIAPPLLASSPPAVNLQRRRPVAAAPPPATTPMPAPMMSSPAKAVLAPTPPPPPPGTSSGRVPAVTPPPHPPRALTATPPLSLSPRIPLWPRRHGPPLPPAPARSALSILAPTRSPAPGRGAGQARDAVSSQRTQVADRAGCGTVLGWRCCWCGYCRCRCGGCCRSRTKSSHGRTSPAQYGGRGGVPVRVRAKGDLLVGYWVGKDRGWSVGYSFLMRVRAALVRCSQPPPSPPEHAKPHRPCDSCASVGVAAIAHAEDELRRRASAPWERHSIASPSAFGLRRWRPHEVSRALSCCGAAVGRAATLSDRDHPRYWARSRSAR